jgi:hypothetical protein
MYGGSRGECQHVIGTAFQPFRSPHQGLLQARKYRRTEAYSESVPTGKLLTKCNCSSLGCQTRPWEQPLALLRSRTSFTQEPQDQGFETLWISLTKEL